MASEITMPKLSDTMTEGRFVCWRKRPGERVERGDVIAEVETDKAVMELEAFAAGILIKTMAREGETVPVGAVLGLIGEAGEMAEGTESRPSEAHTVSSSETAREASEPGMPVTSPGTPHGATPPVAPLQEKASPLVRHLAHQLGVDLRAVRGSGPEGRITQEDLQRYAATHRDERQPSTGVPPQTEPPEQTPPEAAIETATATGGMRRAVANAVSRSWHEIPHFSVTVEIGMESCREIVMQLRGGEERIGYQALTIKACAVALERCPRLLAAGDGTDDDIAIAFAVSLPDGVMMPVVRRCQRLSPLEIERECSRLADRSRGGKLSTTELSGARFTLSNLGMYGVDGFTALIMPGQTAVLAMGSVAERPLVRGGKVIGAPTMRLTLSCDHRIVDGAYAAEFLAELRHLLERPVPLLLQSGSATPGAPE